jgi:O-antigen ligase
MNISEKTFNKVFNLLLLFISISLIFMKPCTWIIILFVCFNLSFLKKLKYNKIIIWIIGLIASPFLLELLFFWNNASVFLGYRALEKTTSLLIFPLFILGNFQRIDFMKLVKNYSLITTLLIFGFVIRFVIFYNNLFSKYYNGVDLWEMGYTFSDTLESHAPALNMHLAFVSICNFYLLFQKQTSKSFLIKKTLQSLLFLICQY